MARPLSGIQKRERLTLTVDPQTKGMLDYIRTQKQISISEWVESLIQKEYIKLQKAEKMSNTGSI